MTVRGVCGESGVSGEAECDAMNGPALIRLGVALAIVPAAVRADAAVSFPVSDGGRVFADESGSGSRDVSLAHGGRYNTECWEPQARAFATAGFHVIAIDFRGYGRSYGPEQQHPDNAPFDRDVLAAAAFARGERSDERRHRWR